MSCVNVLDLIDMRARSKSVPVGFGSRDGGRIIHRQSFHFDTEDTIHTEDASTKMSTSPTPRRRLGGASAVVVDLTGDSPPVAAQPSPLVTATPSALLAAPPQLAAVPLQLRDVPSELHCDSVASLAAALPRELQPLLCCLEAVFSKQRRAWDCGYANIAALLCTLGRLRAIPSANSVRAAAAAESTGSMQQLIEAAWREGFDPKSALTFGRSLAGKTGRAAMVGAPEALALLTHLRLDAFVIEVVDRRGSGTAVYAAAAAYFATGSAAAAGASGAAASTAGATSTSTSGCGSSTRLGSQLCGAAAPTTSSASASTAASIRGPVAMQFTAARAAAAAEARAAAHAAPPPSSSTVASAHKVPSEMTGDRNVPPPSLSGRKRPADHTADAPRRAPSAPSTPRLLPLYFQHDGHSRSILGVLRHPPRLLVRDPSDESGLIRCLPPTELDGKQYQLVGVGCKALSEGEARERRAEPSAAAIFRHSRWEYSPWWSLRFDGV